MKRLSLILLLCLTSLSFGQIKYRTIGTDTLRSMTPGNPVTVDDTLKADGNVIPSTANGFSLGTSALPWDSTLNRYQITSRSISAGGMVLSQGVTDYYTIPSGAGTRLMWIPSKTSFRAGQVVNVAFGDDESLYWDADSIGTFTFAFGKNVKAMGNLNAVFGDRNKIGAAAASSIILNGTSNTIFGGGPNMIAGGSNIMGDALYLNAPSYSAIIGSSNEITGPGDNNFILGGGNTLSGDISDSFLFGRNIYNLYGTNAIFSWSNTVDTVNFGHMFAIRNVPLVAFNRYDTVATSSASMWVMHEQSADTSLWGMMAKKRTTGRMTGYTDFEMGKGWGIVPGTFGVSNYLAFLRVDGDDNQIHFNYSKPASASYGNVFIDNGDLTLSSGNFSTGAGTITSGLINGQTISSAANFTGSIAAATTVTATGIITSNNQGAGGFTLSRNTDNSGGGGFTAKKSRGSITVPTDVQSGDAIFQIRPAPYSNGSYRDLGLAYGIDADSAGGGTSVPIRQSWYTLDNGVNAERMRLHSSGGLSLGNTTDPGIANLSVTGNVGLGTSTFGTSADKVLAILNGTIPSTSPANMVQLYAEDVAASSELKVRDEAGNITVLSPHNFSKIPEGKSEEMAWSFYSERDGKYVTVDMLKLARLLEKLTGEKLVYTGSVK